MSEIREKLRVVVEESNTKAVLIFDWIIQLLIIVSIIAFSIETIPNLDQDTKIALQYIEVLSVAIFTVEYLLRLVVSRNPLKFVFSFYGLIDLVAIIPFYISLGVDLRSVRAIRLLRVFRLLKLVRYTKAINRFHRSIIIAKEELVLFFCTTLILLYISGVAIYGFENEAQPEQFASIFHSIWWAVITLTTVGYGDVYPVTIGGKVFTFFVLLLGIGVFSIPAGLIASALGKARTEESNE